MGAYVTCTCGAEIDYIDRVCSIGHSQTWLPAAGRPITSGDYSVNKYVFSRQTEVVVRNLLWHINTGRELHINPDHNWFGTGTDGNGGALSELSVVGSTPATTEPWPEIQCDIEERGSRTTT
jgi:hypothetical protein